MQIETVKKSKANFVEMFAYDLVMFFWHTDRVKCQY